MASARKKDLIGNEKEENAQEKPYTVNNSQAKLQRLALDEYARSTNERWMELLSDDFYLGETYLVLRDLIALKRTE